MFLMEKALPLRRCYYKLTSMLTLGSHDDHNLASHMHSQLQVICTSLESNVRNEADTQWCFIIK